MGKDNILTIIIVFILGLVGYRYMQELKKIKVGGTGACPRGQQYTRSSFDQLFGSCGVGYDTNFWNGRCECQTDPNTGTTPSSPSPFVTDVPDSLKPPTTLCPWDSSMLAGDRRCIDSTPTAPTIPLDKQLVGYITGLTWSPLLGAYI